MRDMNHKSDIFPPGTLPIFPPGRSVGDRGGTGPSAEGNFHGKCKPTSSCISVKPKVVSNGQRQTHRYPSTDTLTGIVRRRSRGTLSGAPSTRLCRTLRITNEKRPVEYEHRRLGPPGSGWKEHAQGPPSSGRGSSPPGHFRTRRRGPPGATQDTFHSLSLERRRGARLATLPEATDMKSAEHKHVNQGR